MIKKSFFFMASALFFAAPLRSEPVKKSLIAPSTDAFRAPIYFESDSLEYSEASQVIVASGNVTVHQTSYTFQSNHAQFNIPDKSLSAWGHVRFKDILGNQINSMSLAYNADKGSARLLNAAGAFQDWLFAAELAERDDEGNFLLEKARLSTCERDMTKYHLYGYRIRLMPGKRITVKHAVFRLGPVPILYLPYYYYSLGEKHLAFQIYPGQNQSEGGFLRTIWGYAITDQTYAKIYLDYLSKRGVGTGGEFDYYFSDRVKGSVYGFRIFDLLRQEERWNIRLSHWQKFSDHLTWQANGNQLSDDSFPNDFFREDFNRVVRDFNSSSAVTYQKGSNFFRAFGSRSELFDVTSRKFYASDGSAPRIEWNQVQTPAGFWGLEKIISASFTNHYAGKSFYGEDLTRSFRTESDERFSLLRKFQIIPFWSTFVPKLSVSNQWTDRPKGSEQINFTQRLIAESNLRQRFGYNFDLDLTHTFVQRLQNNTGDDLGRETHTLRFFSVVHIAEDLASFRFDTTHNLPKAKGEALAFLERRNYSPLMGELIVDPRDKIEIFFREQYLLYDSNTGSMHPLSTQSELSFGRKALGEDYYSIGTSYFSDRDNRFEIRQAARWTPSKTFKLEGRLYTGIEYKNQSAFQPVKGEITERELLVKKEWRCWIFTFTYRDRLGVTEFQFNLELKLDSNEKEKNSNRQRESEFYPWRGEALE